MKPDNPKRIPAHPPTPQGFASEEPQRHILMTPLMAGLGSLIAFLTVIAFVVVLPTETYKPPPSQNWLPLTNAAVDGRALYMGNGCFYCHSYFSRPQDVMEGLYYLYPRISQPGDYYGIDQSPNILGTERTGPDLSQEGGNHPDDWQVAHYWNPRSTQPLSIMPRFNFWSAQELSDAIAFNQTSGGKEAVLRYAAQKVMGELGHISDGEDPAKYFPNLVAQDKANGTYKANGTPDDTSPSGLAWGDVFDLNTFERSYWLTYDPLPVTFNNLNEARKVFEQRCSGCHGVKGLGNGPAAAFLDPSPDDFSDPGMFTSPTDGDGERYYRMLVGGHGTAMENFGTRLSVEDMWRIVLFLRTIPNGGFETPVTYPSQYRPWTPPPELLNYVKTHPVDAMSLAPAPQKDPFTAAAAWALPGLAPNDVILVGGKLPLDGQTLAALIKDNYMSQVQQAIKDAQGRGEQLPAIQTILDTSGVTWHAP